MTRKYEYWGEEVHFEEERRKSVDSVSQNRFLILILSNEIFFLMFYSSFVMGAGFLHKQIPDLPNLFFFLLARAAYKMSDSFLAF